MIEENDVLECLDQNCNGKAVRPPPEFKPSLDCPMGCDYKISHLNEAESHCMEAHGCWGSPVHGPPLFAQYHEQWKAFRKAKKQKKLPKRPMTSYWKQSCNKCGKKEEDKKFLVCSGCDANVRKRAYYCSKECQTANWQEHKKDCPRKDKKRKN